MSRRGWRWLLGGLVALLTAWAVAPAVVAVYDGIGNPDEPYRYVSPPPTAKTTKKPTTASATVPVRGGKNGAQFANSGESGPQISVYVPAGSLQVPAGTTSITLQATPKAPTTTATTDGTIVSNIYDVEALAGGKKLEVIGTGHQAPTIQMRAPTAKQTGPVLEHRTATGWKPAKTIRVGNDVYQAAAPEFGDWALVQLSNGRGTTGGGSTGGVNVGLLAGGIGVLVFACVVLAIRFRRTDASD